MGQPDFGLLGLSISCIYCICHMGYMPCLPRICALLNVQTLPLRALSYTLQPPETVLVPVTAECVVTTPEMRQIVCTVYCQ